MEQIFNSLKTFITPELLSVASNKLEESESKISATIPSIYAGLLAVLLKKGNSPQLKNIFDEAGNLDILSDADMACGETPTPDQQRIGDEFLQHLLGDKAADFTNAIAADKNITKVATNRLVSIIAPLFTGLLGKMIKSNKWSMPTLLNNIEAEKSQFIGYIPDALKKSFGVFLSSSGQANQFAQNKPKKNNNWIMWLILILLLLLALFWWRSCRNRPVELYQEETITTVAPANDNANRPASTNNNATASMVTLPNGTALQNAQKGGVEDEIIKFLESDKYKNATDNDLKNVWFDLDKINFEFDSTDKLKAGYQDQLNNIIAILKNYPNAKVDIGGLADKKGTEDVNLEISEERAKTFETLLEKAGITSSQIVKTEGFGEEYAKYLASAPDNVRAKDRHITLRFVK